MKLTYHPKITHSQSIIKQKQKEQKPKKTSIEVKGTLFAIDSRYSKLKYIDSGAYGCVASGHDTKKDRKVAIKKVINAFEDLVDGKRILRQIRLLKFLNHQNIITLLDVDLPDKKEFDDVYIITELMETNLHKVIYLSNSQKLTDDHCKYFVYQCLKGLNYMHSANIMHRDLKPSNLLVNKDCKLKICDFGLARGFEDDQQDLEKTEYVVTRPYRAPEVVLKAGQYTKAIDIWAVGCIFAELLGRNTLFPGKDYLQQIQRIVSVLGTPSKQDQQFIDESALKYLKSLPKRSKQNWQNLYPSATPLSLDLLDKMLKFNPQKRATVQQCLSHPYFQELYDIEQKYDYSPKVYDWSTDAISLSKSKLQQLIYKSALNMKR